MIRFILGLVIEGLIGGVALRAALPGEQDWSIVQTMGIGLVTWLVLGLVIRVVLGVVAGLILPVLIIGGLYLWFASKRGGTKNRH
jgi:uncharacterized iron-regulated membrane protein